ncbi:hypothetical protein ACICHK_42810 (plasmid) [Streptomyces sp. AHU1]|uniref:hypothetical protein n=1 Tax=Streptomyces sp. AHU1 TaxID=3377215 RepID=UPI003877A171
MASNAQISDEAATRNGIHALDQAYKAISKCKGDVDSTAGNLANSYKGADGAAYTQLLQSWDAQANVILKNLSEMMDALDQSLKQHGKTVEAHSNWISSASSNQAYNLLTP